MGVKDPDIGRLLAAFHNEKLDRTPNFEAAMEPRNVSRILGRTTDKNLGELPPEERLKVIEAIGQDAIPCNLRFDIEYGSVEKLSDMAQFTFCNPEKGYHELKACCDAVRKSGAGVYCALNSVLTPTYMVIGPVPIESFMYKVVDDRELVERLMDTFLENDLKLIDTIKDLPFDFFYIGDDVSYTGGTMISPDLLDELWVPRMKTIIDAARATGRPVLFHCCGDLSYVLPHLVRWGVDGVHPLQANANNIYEVYEQYGEQLTLVGNIDVMTVLSHGTVEEVRADTEEHIQRLSGNGGYVVCSSHSIIDSIPPENFMAMVDTAQTRGVYQSM